MNFIQRNIPNAITSLNLLCGSIAIVFAFEQKLSVALYWILAASVFDFLDGLVARALNAYSEIGKQLDSLSDMVSFGLAPAIMLFVALKPCWTIPVLNYSPFLLAVFSALRLAKFNIDTRQSVDFIGLPTPANALFFVSFANLIVAFAKSSLQLPMVALILVFCGLMVSEVRLLSLKHFSTNQTKKVLLLILAIVSIAAIILTKLYAGIIIIPAYLILSATYYRFGHENRN
ncbi:MAG TPA: CDP-diacylglycerol--serine O-phosphatidyltransferase [Salinivirgaceae bacterium]|nr:CDP-diacylglycerol--serine O-phosphatidyltransferase [Salinivirgaceae bacterium]